jgi:hypothetical protein
VAAKGGEVSGDWHCKQLPNGSNPLVVCERETLLAEIERLQGVADLGIELTQKLANEIKRLRAEVERKHDYACRMDALAEVRLMEITRLRAAGDALAVAYRTLGGLDVAHDAALLAWEEARRER